MNIIIKSIKFNFSFKSYYFFSNLYKYTLYTGSPLIFMQHSPGTKGLLYHYAPLQLRAEEFRNFKIFIKFMFLSVPTVLDKSDLFILFSKSLFITLCILY